MYNTIVTELQHEVLIITINRPNKLNALNKEVFTELEQVIDEMQTTAEIKSAIITGAGTKAFVAGADITEFNGLNVSAAKELAERGQNIFLKIENSQKPVVAAVNGFALGGGCELAMACHFRIATENAQFGQPEVSLGLIPGYGGTQRLTQLIGKGRAIELLITGGRIDAATALQYGLVNFVVSADELLPKALAILATANAKAPLAVAACIKAANAVFHKQQNGFAVEIEGFSHCFGTSDMLEGTAAFLEKRSPKFSGS